MSSTSDYASSIQSIRQFQVYQFVNAASLTVYVFDYLLTFEQELSLIWNSRWTWMKFLFLLDRYMMVPNFIMQTFLVGTVKYRGNIDCQHLALAWNYLCTIELFLSEIILSLRLWAMWGNNKWIFLGVMSIFVGTAVWQQYDAEIAFKTGDYSFDPLLSNLSKGCVFDARVNHAGIAYLVTLTVDFIMVMLALAPTVRLYISTHGWLGRGSLIYQVYHEGILFYAYVFCLSSACYALVVRTPSNTFLLVPPYLVIRVITSTRMILHTRRLYKSVSEPPTTLVCRSTLNEMTLP